MSPAIRTEGRCTCTPSRPNMLDMSEVLRLVDPDEASLTKRAAAAAAALGAGVVVSTAVLWYTGRPPMHVAVLHKEG